jgi:hypothetical protein
VRSAAEVCALSFGSGVRAMIQQHADEMRVARERRQTASAVSVAFPLSRDVAVVCTLASVHDVRRWRIGPAVALRDHHRPRQRARTA